MADLAGDREHGVMPEWVPEGIDVTVPSIARMYDYMLGGHHNFEVDRKYAEQAERVFPGSRQAVYAHRAFLGRVVRWLIGAGIRQFLDIGSGIPTIGNVHEIVQKAAPRARVMYVDIDPVAVAHTRTMLAENPLVRVLEADLRRPVDIVDHPEVTDLLDFSQPVAVLLLAVVHFIPDADDPISVVTQIRDVLAAGSYLAISHVTRTPDQTETVAKGLEATRQLAQQTSTPIHYRTREQVARMMAGLELVEPGIVTIDNWHPDPTEGSHKPWPGLLAAVGRKRADGGSSPTLATPATARRPLPGRE
jgi:S-adenosyl methyltransferase